LSKLTDDQKKEPRRREILTYRIKNASAPPSQPNTPLPSPEKVAPLPICEFLPKPTPAYDIQLNIDVANMFGKLNMTVPVTKMRKIPFVKREILKILQVPSEKEDPPIMLNTMYLDRPRDKNPPFYLSLGVNDLRLNNCMLVSGASTNVISLKVIKQLGLKTTRPYGNACGIASRKVKVLGVCEDIEVFLIDFPHINILMDILMIDALDAWGMILSRSWSTGLRAFLSMDLTHAHVPMGDEIFQIIYNREKVDRHVMDPDGIDYVNECDYDVLSQTIEYDPSELPFFQEDSIDTLLPWTCQYKDKLAKYHGKETWSIQTLKKEDEKH
jgi:hypothetical protein